MYIYTYIICVVHHVQVSQLEALCQENEVELTQSRALLESHTSELEALRSENAVLSEALEQSLQENQAAAARPLALASHYRHTLFHSCQSFLEEVNIITRIT